MKLADHLDKDTRRKLEKMGKKKKPPSNDKPAKKRWHTEKLTAADIRYLMGMNRDTYKRVRGAVKRK
ncbi:hypothetical protein [Bacillus sp. FJAT-49736]|uniref:hypothetical protein n=1 Tax=Bacillus sp. FJAT-49736 TaxID=2833582 RepID=UPI001BC9DFF0|nr:hypothetical protein [Bacillus sp. FJAT-49736]MBS4171929.1 hypothetical protein [Bacillus sp. FJAT-49736]